MIFRLIAVATCSHFLWPASVLAADPSAPRQIIVNGGNLERKGSIVTVELKGLSVGNYDLTAGNHHAVLQVDESGGGVFIEHDLGMNESRTYEITPASLATAVDQVTAQVKGDVLSFIAADTGTPMLSYQMKAAPVPEGTPPIFSHGAHIHPVYSPAGRLVTGNHPPDHPHHRGIWMAWTKTHFEGRSPDFWNMGKDKSGKLTGEVRFGELQKQWSGPVQAGFISTHLHLDHTSGAEKKVLDEKWTLKTYPDQKTPEAVRRFDLTSVQKTVGTEPLMLPQYHYGGLGVRGNRAWDAENAVIMLTSEGDDRKTGDGKSARWVYIGGQVEGAQTGILILEHPQNFRFPQPLRLNPKNPQLSIAPSQQGDWAIKQGEEYISRYRFVILDGKPDKARFEGLWEDYANPIMASAVK